MAINPPSGSKVKLDIVTPNDLANAIVIPLFTAKRFLVSIPIDSIFDGEIIVEALNADGSFSTCTDASGPNTSNWANEIVRKDGIAQNNWAGTIGASRTLWPFQLRARIVTQATKGSATIEIDYI